MPASPAHERYASLSWLIVAMTVAALAIGAVTVQYFETPPSLLWKLAAAWGIVWLPMFAFALWSSSRLRTESAHAKTAEASYRQLVEQARDVIYRTDAQGRFTFVNPTTSRLTGYSEKELLGRRFVEFIRPDAREDAERFYGRQFVRKTPSTYYEFPALTKDGWEVWFGQYVQALLEDGRVVGFHAVAREITTRRRAENELRRTTELLRALIQTSPLAILSVDHRRNITSWNRAAEEMLGWSEAEVLGKPLPAVLGADEAEADAPWEEALRGSGQKGIQLRRLKRNGTPIDLEIWTRAVRIEKGSPIACIGVLSDITERRRAEKALEESRQRLRESEARYRNLFEHNPLMYFTIDSAGTVLSVNPQGARQLGYSIEELVGRPVTAVFPANLHGAVRAQLGTCLQEPTRIHTWEITKVRKDGAIMWVRETAVAVQDRSQGSSILIMCEDITERRRAEEKLLLSQEIITNAHDPIAIMDLQGRFTFQNPAHATLVGFSDTELLGKTPALFLGDETFTSICRELASAQSYRGEVALRAKDGTLKNLDLSVFTIMDSDGKPSCFVAIKRDISERKRAGEALAASEKRLRTILEAEPECVKIVTGDGILIDMNPAGLAMIEADSLEQVRGRSVCPIITPPYREAFADFTRRVHRGEPGTIEFEIVGLKGTHRWLETHAVPLRDENNQISGVLAITRDISGRKRAEREIEQARSFLGSIVENIPDMVFVKDAKDLRFVQFNKAGEELVGHLRQDLIGKNDFDFFPKEEADFFTAKDREVLESRRLLDVPEEPIETRHRGTRILHTKKIPILDNDGSPRYLLGISEDITERKRTEEIRDRLLAELAESRNRFEMFFRETPSAIAITTVKEGRFIDVNKQAEVLTGYSRDELIGRTTTDMNLYVDPGERAAVMDRMREKGVITNLERQIRTKSGEIRTAIFSLVPVQMGSEACLLAIAHDITERKRAEQELRERSRQQAIEAELSLQAVAVQDLPTLLNTAVKLVANALDADYCEALELQPDGRGLRLYASAGWKGDRIGQVRAAEPGSLAHAALQSNKPAFRSLPADTQFAGPPWLRKHGAIGGMSVSIPGKETPWGVLGVYTAGTRAFSRDDINFIQTVASILAATIERMETEGVLRSANQALRLLSRQLLQVQEDERRTIARDLHDEIGQSLTAIKLNVERAQRTSEQEARRRIMQDCIQIAERVLGQVRNLSLDLHPSILDDLGLAYALKWYGDRLAERAGLRVEVTADPSLPRLSQDLEIACFRIAQEALTNVVRHARAGRADITLKHGAAAVELCVQDDGIGFATDKASAPASVGLASMQERARLLGGTVRIVSTPRGGTKVIATLPLLVASPTRVPAEEVPRS